MDRQTSITVKRFVQALKNHISVDRLILFGSRARGDKFVTGDYDFALVSRQFKSKPFTRRASLLYDLWPAGRDLELLCYTPEEWHRLKNRRGILLNAQSEGIRLL